MTALISAAHWGYYPIVETLLLHGANPNINSTGLGFKTNALFSSYFKKHMNVAKLLLSYGADPAEVEKLNQDSTGFRLSDEDLDKLYSYHNIYKLVYLRRIQMAKHKETVLTTCSEMMFEEICKNVWYFILFIHLFYWYNLENIGIVYIQYVQK